MIFILKFCLFKIATVQLKGHCVLWVATFESVTPHLSHEFPHVVVKHKINSPKINVWCASSRDSNWHIIFLCGTNCNFTKLSRYVAMYCDEKIIFLQDGAPPHFANTVRNYRNEKFPQRWI